MPIADIRIFLQIIRQYHRSGILLGAEMLTKYLELEIPDCKVSLRKTGEAVLERDGKIVASSLEGLQYFEE